MSRIRASAAQLAVAVEQIGDDPQWVESRALIARGDLPSEMFQALAVRPDLMEALSGFGAPLYPGGLLDRTLQERVVRAVSEANACQYCAGSHADTMRRLGIDTGTAALSARELAALDYTQGALAQPPRIDDALWEATRRWFSDEEIVELTLLIGLTAMLNRFNDCLGVRYHDEYAPEGSGQPGA